MISGYFSTDALNLIRIVLQPSLVKNTCDWMYDMLTNPNEKFSVWQSKSETVDIYNRFPYLAHNVIKYAQDHNIVAYAQKRAPLIDFSTTLNHILTKIEKNSEKAIKVEKELKKLLADKVSEGERYEAAATCYSEAIKKGGSPLAYFNLGILIEKGHIQTDLNGEPISEGERYEAAATCYREAIKKGEDPKAYLNLGVLIEKGHIQTDLNGKPISEGGHYEAAATCYREAIKKGEDPKAYLNLGVLIHDERIQTDLNGEPISEGERYEVAATCYREAIKKGGFPEAYFNLGILIEEGHIKVDGNNNPVTESIKTAERLFKKVSTDFPKEVAKFYIRNACELTVQQRLSKIASLLEENHPDFLSIAKIVLQEEDSDLDMERKNILTQGFSVEALTLFEQEDSDSKADEDKEVKSLQSDETPEEVIKDPITLLFEQEEKNRTEIKKMEQNGFESLRKRFGTGKSRIKNKPETLKERGLKLVEAKPVSANKNKGLTVKFTPNAQDEYNALEKTGKERVRTLLQAIEEKQRTGREESLHYEFQGRPVMTRELGKDDRMAYIQQGNLVTVLSLKRHFEPRGLGLKAAASAGPETNTKK